MLVLELGLALGHMTDAWLACELVIVLRLGLVLVLGLRLSGHMTDTWVACTVKVRVSVRVRN